jgi:hypothetical protein
VECPDHCLIPHSVTYAVFKRLVLGARLEIFDSRSQRMSRSRFRERNVFDARIEGHMT